MMKKSYFLFSIILLCMCFCCLTINTKAQDINSDLVVYFPLDGDAISGLEDGTEGVIGESIEIADGFNGKVDGGLNFFGVNDSTGKIVFDDTELNLPIGNEERSMALWFKPDADAGNCDLISYGSPGTNGASMHFALRNGEEVIRIGHWYNDYDFTIDASESAWLHIAYTYDGSVINFYLDGELVSIADIDFDKDEINTILNGEFCIGGRNRDVNIDPFKGILDEVRIYSRVLTGEDILALYTLDPDNQPSDIFINNSLQNNIKVFPNPARDNLFIPNYKGLVKIYSILGIKVIDQDHISESVNIANLENGLYIVQTEIGYSKFLKK